MPIPIDHTPVRPGTILAGLRLLAHMLCGIILLSQPTAAQGVQIGAFEDLVALDARIAAALTAFGAGRATPLDPRLRLAACPAPAVIEPPVMLAVTVRCPILGWRIRVPMRDDSGELSGEHVIRRGDLVELASNGPGFAVTMMVVALEDGMIGKSVRVKSLVSQDNMVATVTGPGQAALSR